MPVKNEKEAYEKIIKMSNNNYYTTGNLLDSIYFKEHYKLIAIDLSKQIKLKDPKTTWKPRSCSNNVFHYQKIWKNSF